MSDPDNADALLGFDDADEYDLGQDEEAELLRDDDDDEQVVTYQVDLLDQEEDDSDTQRDKFASERANQTQNEQQEEVHHQKSMNYDNRFKKRPLLARPRGGRMGRGGNRPVYQFSQEVPIGTGKCYVHPTLLKDACDKKPVQSVQPWLNQNSNYDAIHRGLFPAPQRFQNPPLLNQPNNFNPNPTPYQSNIPDRTVSYAPVGNQNFGNNNFHSDNTWMHQHAPPIHHQQQQQQHPPNYGYNNYNTPQQTGFGQNAPAQNFAPLQQQPLYTHNLCTPSPPVQSPPMHFSPPPQQPHFNQNFQQAPQQQNFNQVDNQYKNNFNQPQPTYNNVQQQQRMSAPPQQCFPPTNSNQHHFSPPPRQQYAPNFQPRPPRHFQPRFQQHNNNFAPRNQFFRPRQPSFRGNFTNRGGVQFSRGGYHQSENHHQQQQQQEHQQQSFAYKRRNENWHNAQQNDYDFNRKRRIWDANNERQQNYDEYAEEDVQVVSLESQDELIETNRNEPQGEPDPEIEEDEETKAYRKKIEEQKRQRAAILAQKEKNRKMAILQKETGAAITTHVRTAPPPQRVITTTNKVLATNPNLRLLTRDESHDQNAARVAKEKAAAEPNLSSNFLSSRTVIAKDEALLDTPVVVVRNLSITTAESQLRRMSQGVGVIQNLELSSKQRQAKIRFKSAASAHAFYKKYQRYMLDLSMIQVELVPAD